MSQHVPTIPSWSPEMVGAIVAVAAKHQGNQRSLVHHQLALPGFVPAFWPWKLRKNLEKYGKTWENDRLTGWNAVP